MSERRRKSEEEPTPPAPEAEPSFDERLARLEAIVGELEEASLGLEPAIARYEEGVALLKQCRALLERHRQRVEELSASGELAPYPHDPDAGATAG
jgi:exodeoxyribonuclease VII small subunit